MNVVQTDHVQVVNAALNLDGVALTVQVFVENVVRVIVTLR